MSELKNEFSWSKSRDDLFRECKRRYFFEKYGFWGGWDRNAPENIKELYILKNIKPRYMWMGQVVHDVIKRVLLNYKSGDKVDLGYAISILRKKLQEDFSSSNTKSYKKYPKNGGLFEHEYDMLIPKDKWDELFKRAEDCIINFFNSDTFRYIKSVDPKNWIFLEDFLSFDFEGTKVYLAIDFALKDGENIILYDWKTGKERDDKNIDTQLACYAFYILQKYNLPPGKIIAKLYNVSIDKEDVFQITDDMINDAKSYIRQSIREMKSMLKDDKNNIADIMDFPKTPSNYFCNNCSFKRICLMGNVDTNLSGAILATQGS